MLLRLKETKTILLPTLQHKFYTLQVLSVCSQIYMADGGCGVGHQHPGPAPGVLVLGLGWWPDQPAGSRPFPRMPAPHLASFPPCGSNAMVSHRVRSPTPPFVTWRAVALIEPTVHLFCIDLSIWASRSASLSAPPAQWSRMLLFANHHLTLSVGICWNRA